MSANFEDIIARGTTGAKPAAGIPGRLYFDTDLDKLQRDNGATWEDVERADSAGTSGWKYPADGRLTLESGVPISTSDQNAKATLYYTPYVGDDIALFDGAVWNIITFAELSLNIGAYTANKNYDIWVYDNAGTPTLDSTVWTNDTTRATALVRQNGVLCKTGDLTRRYIGTIRINAAGGQCDDSLLYRYVWNYYNQVLRQGAVHNTNAHTYTTGTVREWNNSNSRVNFVLGLDSIMQLNVWNQISAGTSFLQYGLGLDSTIAITHLYNASVQGAYETGQRSDSSVITLGFHYLASTEYGQAGITFSAAYAGYATGM